MNTIKILLAEIGYRKLNFTLSLFAVTIAVTLLVSGPVLVDGHARKMQTELQGLEDGLAESETRLAESEAKAAEELAGLENETRAVMRDMGFNLTIVHRDTDITEFWAKGYAAETMDQECVKRLADDPNLSMVNHLVATLQEKIDWEGREVLLVGYLPETPLALRPQTKFAQRREAARKKSLPMGVSIEPGTAQLGHALAEGRNVGESIELQGKTFRIAEIVPEKGSLEDITIAVSLQDAQAILDKPGRINHILALDCRCAEADLPKIRKQVREILPETYIIRDKSRADARAKMRRSVAAKHQVIVAAHQRNVAEREKNLREREKSLQEMQGFIESLSLVITPLVVLAAAIWIGLLALANVRERRSEIGILRALGKGSGTISTLFLGKAVLMGLLGAAAGLLLGVGLAFGLGVGSLGLAAEQFTVHYNLLWAALLGAPLLAAAASYLPLLSALVQDPAVVLRDQ